MLALTCFPLRFPPCDSPKVQDEDCIKMLAGLSGRLGAGAHDGQVGKLGEEWRSLRSPAGRRKRRKG